jgi:GT2 family glycosyltransferase
MYSEELDLCRRLADRGWRVQYDPAAVVIHHEGRSSDQVVPARHLHFQRSRVRYFRKHHGPASAAVVRAGVLLGYAIEMCIEGIKWTVGHRRPLRRERMQAYVGVLRDGLG